MFKSFQLPWFKKPNLPLPPGEVPKSFTISGEEDNRLYKISMEDTFSDFVDVDYKKLSYAEAAALSKSKQQASQLASAKTGVKSSVPRPTRATPLAADSPETDDEPVPEKDKRNRYFLKNKVYKQSDRNPKRKAI